MKTSEQIDKIAPAFLLAQKAIKFAVKDAQNPHLKNRYADLPSVIDAVKQALNDSGIAIIQTAGDLIEGKMVLSTVLMHESGQWFRSDTTMPLTKQDAQGYGSAVTYARRYALSAMTGLYQDDDDGERQNNAKEIEQQLERNSDVYKEAVEELLKLYNGSKSQGAVQTWLNSKPPLKEITFKVKEAKEARAKKEVQNATIQS